MVKIQQETHLCSNPPEYTENLVWAISVPAVVETALWTYQKAGYTTFPTLLAPTVLLMRHTTPRSSQQGTSKNEQNQLSLMRTLLSSPVTLCSCIFSCSISTRHFNSHCSTSPSMYLQVLGTAGLSDECGTVGPILTNPIVAFPPGGLSTWIPPPLTDSLYYEFGLGNAWIKGYAFGAFNGDVGTFAPLDVKDLACPTWGLGRSTASNGSVITTIGPPFLPLLRPNTQMFSLDPTWARLCTALNLDTYANDKSFVILDPPMALTPKAMMVSTSDNAPKLTPRPNPADPTTMADPPVTSSTSPARPVSVPVNPQKSPTNAGDPSKGGATTKPSPVQPKFPEPAFPVESQRHPADLSSSPNANPDKPVEASKVQPASLPESTDLVFQQEDSRHSQTQGLGAMIYNALGRSGNEPSRDTGNVETITLPNAGVQEVHVGGTQTLSVSSLGVQVDGVAYSAGGPPLTLSGKVFTFVPQPNNNDRYKDTGNIDTITLPNAGVQEVHIGGTQTLSISSLGVQVDGVAYSAGGPPLTLSGKVFTFVPQPNNNHQYSDRPSDPPSEPTNDPRPSSSVLSIAGQPITLNPSRMLVAGSTILPGDPPITLSNTPLSLASSGILFYGSSSILLYPQSGFTIHSEPITANAAGFVINGGSISPVGSAQTMDGTIISLGQSGHLAIGNTLISLPTPETHHLAGSEIMIAGQTVTPNPSELTVAGTTISAGGPAATVGGTVIYLQTSGSLIVGSTTIQLSALHMSFSSTPSVEGLVAQGTSSSLAGKTGASVAGSVVSLEKGGKTPDAVAGSVVDLKEGGKTLDVGSAGIAMPTGGTNKTGAITPFKGGQERDIRIQMSMIRVVGVWAAWLLLV